MVALSSGKSYLVSIPWVTEEVGDLDDLPATTAIVEYDRPRVIGAQSEAGLAGMAVIADPALGHIAVFRAADGVMSAMNLTVQLKLVELERHLKVGFEPRRRTCPPFRLIVCRADAK